MKMWKRNIVTALQDQGLRSRLKDNFQVLFVAAIWIALTVGLFAYDAAHPKQKRADATQKPFRAQSAKFH